MAAKQGYKLYFACIRIEGDRLDFDYIRRRLLVEPTDITRKGDRIARALPPVKKDYWIVRAPVNKTAKLETHLQKLQEIFKGKENALREIATQYLTYIYCSYHTDRAMGDIPFPSDFIRWCGNTGIGIRLSVLVQSP